MKYKTLFRILIKFIGAWMITDGVANMSGGLVHLISCVLVDDQISGIWAILALAPVAIQIALGLYLFFDGLWIVNKAVPRNHPYCQKYGYELHHVQDDRSPECGTAFRLTLSS